MVDIGRVQFSLSALGRADWKQSAEQVLHLQEEIKLHIEFCKDYGLSVKDIENQEEDQGKSCPTVFAHI